MTAHDPPELTPEGQTLTLRWVLALAHEDRDAAKLVLDEMGHLQVHPADTILDLGLMTVAFAGALGALGFVDAFHNDPGFRERSRDHDGARRGDRVVDAGDPRRARPAYRRASSRVKLISPSHLEAVRHTLVAVTNGSSSQSPQAHPPTCPPSSVSRSETIRRVTSCPLRPAIPNTSSASTSTAWTLAGTAPLPPDTSVRRRQLSWLQSRAETNLAAWATMPDWI